MSIFITNIAKHDEIKTEILRRLDEVDLTIPRVRSIAIDIEKAKEWYSDAIEQFRLNQIANGVPTEEYVFDQMTCWANIYPKGTSMNAHTHPDYRFYSIHYLQKSATHPHTEMSADGETWEDPLANEGDIIFFGGETFHRVQENALDDLRITIGMSASSIGLREDKLATLREARNKLLEETDWWELPSQLPMSLERETYRQELRDITEKYISLNNVIWPIKPN